jgi:hypothetical protein
VTKSILVACTLLVAGTANASVIFNDNFNAEAAALNYTGFANWTVYGQVDTVATVNPYGIGDCDGICVDLDGTPGDGYMISREIAFSAGERIFVSFDVSGNQRNDGLDYFFHLIAFSPRIDIQDFEILSGYSPLGIQGSYANNDGIAFSGQPLAGGSPYKTYRYAFTPLGAGTLNLQFATSSYDNIGPILDNVLVTQGGAVPEPATWAMLIAGFGLVGFAARRRRALSAA